MSFQRFKINDRHGRTYIPYGPHSLDKVKNPKKKRRIVDYLYITRKKELVNIMIDAGYAESEEEAAKAYDMMTNAIRAWIFGISHGIEKGMHAKLMLTHCFTVNFCWIKGPFDKIRQYFQPDFIKIWVNLNDTKEMGVRNAIRSKNKYEIKKFMEEKGLPWKNKVDSPSGG